MVGPCLVRCEDNADDKTVLEKVGMPSVHLLLAVNDILNKLVEPCFGGDRQVLLDILRTEVNVVPHSYQGREGAFAGPECSKILDNLAVLEPHLESCGEEGLPFLEILRAFHKVKKEVFGNYLGELWEESLDEFAAKLIQAHESVGLPVSPKLHIIQVHVKQFVQMNKGQGLGRLNEAVVEVLHATFLKIWMFYQVSDEMSPTYLEHLLKAVIRCNADNTKKV